jgi:hypothetical protein
MQTQDGLAYYPELVLGLPLSLKRLIGFLSGAVASREVADVGQLQPAAQSFISSLSRPAQSEADIRLQVVERKVLLLTCLAL